jgi:hypothetical protein
MSFILLMSFLVAWFGPVVGPGFQALDGLYRIDASSLAPGVREQIVDQPGVAWWVQLGPHLLVAGQPSRALPAVAAVRVADSIDPDAYALLRQPPPDLAVLVRDGNLAIAPRAAVQRYLAGHPTSPPGDGEAPPHGHHDFTWQPLPSNAWLGGPAESAYNEPSHTRQDLVDQVSDTRTMTDVTTMATIQFPSTTTRRTGTAGNVLARDWLKMQLESLGYSTTLQAFSSPYGTSHNVVGEIAGRTRPQEVYIIGGHFDSTSPQASSNAPGAEDNASGTAGILEMARILAAYPPQATVRFIPFSGEEQGLYGSEYYVSQLSAAERARIKGVFIMDMIGYKSQAYPLNVLLETNSSVSGAVNLVNTLNSNAQTYTTLDVDISYYAWGSDHVPFLDVNIPAVLLIEQEYDSYSCYHQTCDTPNRLTPAQAGEVLRMLIAALDATAGTCELADINCDGLVDVLDIQLVANAWSGSYNRLYDLNHDGWVDIVDVMMVGAEYGVGSRE